MKLTISNYLIIICFIFTIYSFYDSSILFFWMNNISLHLESLQTLVLQFLLYSFLHGNIFHILFNSIFLYVFWNKVEQIIWKNNYLIFFIFATLFIWLFILLLSKWNTIWISWFTMALLTYYTIILYKEKNNEYKWWITAIIVSLLIWFSPEISFVWHLWWVIYWVFFYIFFNKFLVKNKN